jgi:N-acetyltransferase
MRTYSRNVRRAWDGEDYRPPKRQRVEDSWGALASSFVGAGFQGNENRAKSLGLEDNLERAIRETSVAALSSSPSRKNSTIFSAESREDDMGCSTITPPSSPPPALQLTPPNVKARKPTFSFLDKAKKEKKDLKKAASRKRDARSAGLDEPQTTRHDSEPLSEILNSSARAPAPAPPTLTQTVTQNASSGPDGERTPIARPPAVHAPPRLTAPKQNLVQTVLDLGQPLVPTTCPQCQMSYTPSLAEDTQLHNMYHHRDSSGIELGRPFLKSAMRWCYQVPHIPGSVVVVDRKIALPGRRVVQKVLEIVNKELGSVDIKEEDLWSQRVPDGGEHGEEGRKCDRYKAFLHVIDEKCVGICLAERITKAHRVLPSETATSETIPLNGHFGGRPTGPATPAATETNEDEPADVPSKPEIPTPVASPDTSSFPSSSISITEATYPAVVGVSRIWTSRAFRHKGIANNLLECVTSQFIYGMEIEPHQVAFSQPTESGAALARAWFGEPDGWAVYREE